MLIKNSYNIVFPIIAAFSFRRKLKSSILYSTLKAAPKVATALILRR